MVQIVLIGIGAGLATALLFASLASGSLFAVLLFYLSPLPILIAGLGWSYWAGLVAALTSGITLALAFGPFFALAFFFGVGLPAWWLGYLALLSRPAERVTADGLEWYPVGRLVLWAAVIGAINVVVAIPFFGTDAESFHDNLRTAIETALGLAPTTPSADGGQRRLIDADMLARLAPAMVASLTTIILVANLWLAARVVKLSGQLRRPWPDLPAITFPPRVPILLAAAIAGIFLPGLLGIIADVLAATLMIAYAFLGFAVLHVITRGTGSRGAVLTGVYVAVIIFGWPALIMSVLGLADTAIDLRGRAARKRGPPTLH
jgi:hypothetical protein